MSSAIPFPLKIQLGKAQNIAIGAASVKATNAFTAQTYAIRVASTGACHIRIGDTNVAAVATDTIISASQVGELIGVAPGQFIAAIQDGASTGNLNITEMTR